MIHMLLPLRCKEFYLFPSAFSTKKAHRYNGKPFSALFSYILSAPNPSPFGNLNNRDIRFQTVILLLKVPMQTYSNETRFQSLEKGYLGWLAGQLTESTRRLYRGDIEDFFGGPPTGEGILSLSDDELKDWRNQAVRKNPDDFDGLEASTVTRKLAALSSFYSYLQAKGLITVNPASPSLVKRPRVAEWQPQMGLLPAEMAALISACTIPNKRKNMIGAAARDLALITLLYTSLLRRSEAAGASWGDVKKQAEHYWLKIPLSKGGSGQRVKLEPVAIRLLNLYLEKMGGRSRFEKHFAQPLDRCPIFVSLDNAHYFERISGHSINTIVQRRAALAELPHRSTITAHILRHTGITHMILAGKNPLAVQTMARHKELSTTMVYAALAQQLLESPGYVLAGNVEDVLDTLPPSQNFGDGSDSANYYFRDVV